MSPKYILYHDNRTKKKKKKKLQEQGLQLQMVWPSERHDLDIMEYGITWRDRRKRKAKYCGKFTEMLGKYMPSTLAKAVPQ